MLCMHTYPFGIENIIYTEPKHVSEWLGNYELTRIIVRWFILILFIWLVFVLFFICLAFVLLCPAFGRYLLSSHLAVVLSVVVSMIVSVVASVVMVVITNAVVTTTATVHNSRSDVVSS